MTTNSSTGTADDEERHDPTPPSASSSKPVLLGPYRVVRRLGRGGMAETLQARLERPGGFGRDVCIKRVLESFLDDTDFREQFALEAVLLSELNHPNIVSAFDYAYDDKRGDNYLVMELVDGSDLTQLKTAFDARMPPAVAAHVAAEIAEALHHAHTREDADGRPRNIVHRDISPQNILISRHGQVKLIDFGIAKFEGRPKYTRTAQAKGKLSYMSPEQLQERGVIGPPADIFALGIVLYELLAGFPPFTEENDAKTLSAILTGRYLRCTQAAPHVDHTLAAFVDRMLNLDPTERPQAPEVAAFLRICSTVAIPAPKRELITKVSELLSDTTEPTLGSATLTHEAIEADDAALRFIEETSLPRTQSRSRPSPPPATPKAPSLTPPPIPDAMPRPQRWKAALAAVALLASGGLATAYWVRRPQQDQPSATPSTTSSTTALTSARAEPKAAPPVDLAPTPTQAEHLPKTEPSQTTQDVELVAKQSATTSLSRRAQRKATRPAPSKQGSLKVRVINWGYVWIDDKFYGKAPVQVELPPGKHTVSAGHKTSKPDHTDSVTVRAERLEEHVIRLNAPFFDAK